MDHPHVDANYRSVSPPLSTHLRTFANASARITGYVFASSFWNVSISSAVRSFPHTSDVSQKTPT